MRRLNPRELGILLSLEPAFGSFSGIIFLGETLYLSQWMGIICVMGASAGNVLSGRANHLPARKNRIKNKLRLTADRRGVQFHSY